MKVLVLGATGGTGRQLVQQALDQGHQVTAFARDPSKVSVTHANLRTVRGDVLVADTVQAAVAGQEAVLSALGVRMPVRTVVAIALACQIVIRVVAFSQPAALFIELGIPLLATVVLARRNVRLADATRTIVHAMEQAGVKRLVFESSLGVGDSKWKMGVVHNLVAIPLFLGGVFADKEVQERIIAASSLDWVVVRPAVLTNAPRRNVYRTGSSVGNWFRPSRIARSDVAAFMLKEMTDEEYVRKAPGLAY